MIDNLPLRSAFPHPGNAADDLDCLPTIDRWLVTGDLDKIDAVVQQQQWPETSLGDIRHAWFKLTGLYPSQGPIERGHGWRCWYADGSMLDSRMSAWVHIPEKIVLGVSYCGMKRWMFQGGDPYWMDAQGYAHDSRTNYPDEHINPRWELVARIQRGEIADTVIDKWGVWVSDEEMRRYRLLAVMAFAL